MAKRLFYLAFYTLLIFVFNSIVTAQVPRQINYQAVIKDKNGNPVNNDAMQIEFKIYDSAEGGEALWSEVQTIKVKNGHFSVYLGEVNPIPESLFNGDQRYITCKIVNDTEMLPRGRMNSVGYAAAAANTKKLGGKEASEYVSKDQENVISTNMIKDNVITVEKILPDIVSSINNVKNDGANIDLVAGDGVKITPDDDNNQITISAIGSGGVAAPLDLVGDDDFVIRTKNSNKTTFGYLGHKDYGVWGTKSLGLSNIVGGLASVNDSAGVIGANWPKTQGFLGHKAYGVYGQNISNNFGYLGGEKYAAYAKHNNGSFGFLASDSVGVYGEHPNGYYGGLGGHAYGVMGINTETSNRGGLGCILYGAVGIYSYGKKFYTGYLGWRDASVYGIDEINKNRGLLGSDKFGVYGKHNSGNFGYFGGDTVAVYGKGENRWAGYFDGDVHITGNLTGVEVGDGVEVPLDLEGDDTFVIRGKHLSSNAVGFVGHKNYGIFASKDGVINAGLASDSAAVYGFYPPANFGYLGHEKWGAYGANINGGFGYLGSDDYGAYGQSKNENYGFLASDKYGAYGEHNSGNFGYFGSDSCGVLGQYNDSDTYAMLGLEGVGVKAVNQSYSYATLASRYAAGVFSYGNVSEVSIADHNSGVIAHRVQRTTGELAKYNWGVEGRHQVSKNTGSLGGDSVAVYGKSENHWAGYFDGDVHITGSLTGQNGFGDITAVNAGLGITGGGESGDVSIAVQAPLVLPGSIQGSDPAKSTRGVLANEQYGVYGEDYSNNNFGILGYNSFGVYGAYNAESLGEGNRGYLGSQTCGVEGIHANGNFGELGGENYAVFGKYIKDNNDNRGSLGSINCGVYGINNNASTMGKIASDLRGVYGQCNDSWGFIGGPEIADGPNYGVYGQHNGSSNEGYLGGSQNAVYGKSSSGYAGYFDGDVHITGTLTGGGNLGDISGVTAGDGLTGGGTEGEITLDVEAGTGITVTADVVALDTSYTDGLYINEGQANSITSAMITDNEISTNDLAMNVISSLDGVTNNGSDIDLVA